VRDQPVQQAPPAQKLRLRYAKRGRLRFTSHRDFGRAFERAVQRAGIPVAFSSGFSPHPRISYANASPTGAASEAEYLEIGVTRPCRPAEVRRALDAALPDGLDVLDVVVAGSGSLADRLEAALWRVDLPGLGIVDVESAVERFLRCDELLVERMTKRGVRSFDCRGAVVRLSTRDGKSERGECAIMEMVVRHGTPAVRPDDILAGLRQIAGLVPPVAPLQTRLAQGPLDPESGDVGDPFEPDRDVPTVGSDR
jgi:radical SAM-linked protein